MSTATPSYANAAAITFTSLNSLATSSTFAAGGESAAIANGTNKYDDVRVTGSILVGTTPTTGTQILVYVVGAIDETPNWPDVFDGTDSTETLTSVGVGAAFLKLAAVLSVDSATTDRAYPLDFNVAPLFGGEMPRDWTLFVTHNTAVNLKSTGHSLKYQGLKTDIA